MRNQVNEQYTVQLSIGHWFVLSSNFSWHQGNSLRRSSIMVQIQVSQGKHLLNREILKLYSLVDHLKRIENADSLSQLICMRYVSGIASPIFIYIIYIQYISNKT